jgi:hypothetical protein
VIIGLSLLVVAVGATLTWAVNADVAGVDVQTIGVILLVVGLAGLLVSLVLVFTNESWATRGPGGPSQ